LDRDFVKGFSEEPTRPLKRYLDVTAGRTGRKLSGGTWVPPSSTPNSPVGPVTSQLRTEAPNGPILVGVAVKDFSFT
jgi:hypothetical protein